MTEQNSNQAPDLKVLLSFVVDILHQVEQWTSKHCVDCMQNRFRAKSAIAYIEKVYLPYLKKDISPEQWEKVKYSTLGGSPIAEEIQKESSNVFDKWQAQKKMFE